MSRETKDTKEYVSILASDGTFRLPVPEGTPGEVKREWSVDDRSGVKNELVFKALSGKITGFDIVDTEFGTLVQVDITDKDGALTISTGVNNNFGGDLLKKLPNLQNGKEYRLAPYSFKDDKENIKKGISITESDESGAIKKIDNFFYDAVTKTVTNGMPVADEGIKDLDGKKRTNAWKKYFMDVEEFLVDYAKANLTGRFSKEAPVVSEEQSIVDAF